MAPLKFLLAVRFGCKLYDFTCQVNKKKAVEWKACRMYILCCHLLFFPLSPFNASLWSLSFVLLKFKRSQSIPWLLPTTPFPLHSVEHFIYFSITWRKLLLNSFHQPVKWAMYYSNLIKKYLIIELLLLLMIEVVLFLQEIYFWQ